MLESVSTKRKHQTQALNASTNGGDASRVGLFFSTLVPRTPIRRLESASRASALMYLTGRATSPASTYVKNHGVSLMLLM